MKILHAPMNFAMMPLLMVEHLRKLGHDAHHILYGFNQNYNRFNFPLDKVYGGKATTRHIDNQLEMLKQCLDENYDIYHFWQRSLIFKHDCSELTGLDLPLIKVRGARILHRFTGFDLRLPSWDLKVNPYSPFRYGCNHPFDETEQLRYIDYIRQYVDQFLVQDPELHQFMPEAKIIPRALDLSKWQYVGIENNPRPLVVHAPTNEVYKGTPFILKAIEDLQDEGLDFDFKIISGMPHEEALAWYKKADIIVDQILIGATGVLTLEAWALGKPVVVYLREDLFKPFYGEIPAANANPDTIKNSLRNLIKDYEWRKELSQKGRATVEKHHDISNVVQNLAGVYKDVMAAPVKKPTTTADISYLQTRISEIENFRKPGSLPVENQAKPDITSKSVARPPVPTAEKYAAHTQGNPAPAPRKAHWTHKISSTVRQLTGLSPRAFLFTPPHQLRGKTRIAMFLLPLPLLNTALLCKKMVTRRLQKYKRVKSA